MTVKCPTLSDVQMESTETRYYLLLWEILRLIVGVVNRDFHKKDGTGLIFTIFSSTAAMKGHYVPNA